jgi:hypothetical protein
MPFYLKEKDLLPELEGVKSVLIVPCRFCPAASLAVSEEEPYIEFFRRGFRTAAYERFIGNLKAGLEAKGVETGVFESRCVNQFVLCSWTSKKRNKLLERAKNYEALLVLGCESAVRTVQDSVASTSCKVVQGMDTEGIMSLKPRFQLPCNLTLELDSVTPASLGENPLHN